jgi:hypothetical protein
MGHVDWACKELRELEFRIHASVRAIAHNSRSAAHAARISPHGNRLDFEALRANYAAERIRLKTLIECLALHQRIHGCNNGQVTGDQAPASIEKYVPSRPNGRFNSSGIAGEIPGGGSQTVCPRMPVNSCANQEAGRAIAAEDRRDRQVDRGALAFDSESTRKFSRNNGERIKSYA